MADHDAAQNFIDEFAKIIATENLTAEHVYNADETALFWHYCHRKTLSIRNSEKSENRSTPSPKQFG